MESKSPIDLHWRSFAPLARDVGTRRSLYLTMRDGTRIAIDVHLPSKLAPGEKVPTIIRQTRYFRSVEIAPLIDSRFARDAVDIAAPTRERFLHRGYAWVDVDVRGSGASSGSCLMPWGADEVADGGEVVRFVVSQPWSNGLVGSTGISYDGTTAEMLLCNGHEAVRAVAPRFSLFCAYEDVAFPGGAHLSWFTKGWARFNYLLDRHRFHEAMAELVYVIARGRANEPDAVSATALRFLLDRLGRDRVTHRIASALGAIFRGARRVDDDATGAERDRSVTEHEKNGDVHAICSELTFRDDVTHASDALTIADISPRGHLDRLRSYDGAVYSYGGYLDGAYGQATARRFRNVPGGRMILGPWGHAGVIAHDPLGQARSAAFDHDAELLRFFDLHLKGKDDGIGTEAPIHYFTLGENRWRTSSTWPPAEVALENRFLTVERALETTSPRQEGAVAVRASDFGTGERTRWRGVLAAFVPADYPDFEARARGEVHFDTAPFEIETRLTGHPHVHVFVRSAADDFLLMAFLLDVSPDGSVAYVTEGQLRALHRRDAAPENGFVPITAHHSFRREDAAPMVLGEPSRMSIGMLPTSYAVPRGHRLRLVFTLGDRDHFARVGPASAEVDILVGPAHPSALELPLI